MDVPNEIIEEVRMQHVTNATVQAANVPKKVTKTIADNLIGLKVELPADVVCFETHQDSPSPVKFLKLILHDSQVHIANKEYEGVYTYAMVARQAAQHIEYDGETKDWYIPKGKVLEITHKLEKGGVFIKVWDKAQIEVDLTHVVTPVRYKA